jgi:hypothetical protein
VWAAFSYLRAGFSGTLLVLNIAVRLWGSTKRGRGDMVSGSETVKVLRSVCSRDFFIKMPSP